MKNLPKVLITGGAGFIGSAVVRRCLAAGYPLVIVDDFSRGSRQSLPPGVTVYDVDVCDASALAEVFRRERPEIVSHHAALVSVRESVEQPERYWQVNVEGTANVLSAAIEVGAHKLIFASSGGAIYGNATRLPLAEDAPCRPLSPYGKSKLAAEDLIAKSPFAGQKIVLRYANVYGPGQDPTGNNGVIAIFAHALLNGGEPRIYGDGFQTRDYVYVADVAMAHLAALRADRSGVYNIATGQERSLNQVYGYIKTVLGVRGVSPRYLPAHAYEVGHNSLDIRRAQRFLGWMPQIPFQRGLAITLRSIRQEMEARSS